MAWFEEATEPPPKQAGALEYVIWVARQWMGAPHAEPSSAVTQDLGIYGDDVDDFALKLAERYGDWIADWPWDEYADLNEGVSPLGCLMLPLFPITIALRIIRGQPIIGAKHGANLKRLELHHVAHVLERGEWVDP